MCRPSRPSYPPGAEDKQGRCRLRRRARVTFLVRTANYQAESHCRTRSALTRPVDERARAAGLGRSERRQVVARRVVAPRAKARGLLPTAWLSRSRPVAGHRTTRIRRSAGSQTAAVDQDSRERRAQEAARRRATARRRLVSARAIPPPMKRDRRRCSPPAQVPFRCSDPHAARRRPPTVRQFRVDEARRVNLFLTDGVILAGDADRRHRAAGRRSVGAA